MLSKFIKVNEREPVIKDEPLRSRQLLNTDEIDARTQMLKRCARLTDVRAP